MAHRACLVCFISTVNGRSNKKKRKEEAYSSKAGAGSGHITNLKQSILESFNIYGWNIPITSGITMLRDLPQFAWQLEEMP